MPDVFENATFDKEYFEKSSGHFRQYLSGTTK